MMTVYRIAVYCLIPFIFLGLLCKGLRNRSYWCRWSERLGFVPREVANAGPYDFMLHAVSVGEARAAVPLINKLLNDNKLLGENKNYRILVTTTTPTGSEMVKLMLADKVSHCYLPYDLGWSMRRFFGVVQPKTTLVMETEIWPNLIHCANRAHSLVIYLNVRLSARSYQQYAKLPSLVHTTLAQVDHFAVQGVLDAKHLGLLGVAETNISQTGNIKFDIKFPADLQTSAKTLRQQLGQHRLVWIAGSTRDGEEEQLLSVYQQLKIDFPSLLLVIVPRHPERFDSVARKVQKVGLNIVRRSEHSVGIKGENVDVYLGDTMGELSVMYASADIAFVGGSLVALGGQNILEPCALGIPVLFGPHMFNFTDISRWAINEGAGRMVKNSQALQAALAELLTDPSLRDEMGKKGLQFVEAHRGALEKNFALIKKLTAI